MKTKSWIAAWALGSAVTLSGASFAVDKDAKPAGGPKPTLAEAKDKAEDAKPEVKTDEAKPTEAKGAASDAGGKLNKPWSDINSLSEEQKSKIVAVHKKSLAEANAIEKKEKEDILALLTDAQKAEMKDAADKKKKDAAAKRAAEKKAAAK